MYWFFWDGVLIHSTTSSRKRWEFFFIALGGGIGGLTLLEYITGLNLGIDELLFIDYEGIGKLYPPGRLAPVTAITLLDLSVGLCLLLKKRPHYKAAQFCFFVAMLISFQAIVAYSVGVQSSFGFAAHTRIALHTAVGFILLSVSYLMRCAHVGFLETILSATSAGSSARRLIFAAIFVPPLAYALEVAGTRWGMVDADSGTLIRVVASVVFFVVMVWRNSELLHHSDRARDSAIAKINEQEQEKRRLLSEARLNEAVQASEARLRAIFESAFDAIVGMDDQGNITDWNPRAEYIFGWSRAEVIGKSMADTIIPPQFREAHRRGLERYLSSGVTHVMNRSIEVEALRRSGEVFPIQLAISPIQVGPHRSFSAFIADISERKQNEKDLITTRQQALDAVRVKSEFLANMSHEIRTPMNGIIGMADLLMDTRLNETQSRYTKIIQESGANLLTIINDILDFSKIDAGKLKPETIDFELVPVVETQIELMHPKAAKKGIALKARVHPAIPAVIQGDPGRISQILLNLIGNAIKFTETGSIDVQVDVETKSKRLCFSVKDTGIGISEKNAEKLFQPFSQADGTTARKFGGTGLGLSICKKLVEMMGGEIGLKSSEGSGSTFWFTLPLVASEKKLSPVDEEKAPVPQLGLQGLRILVAEDIP